MSDLIAMMAANNATWCNHVTTAHGIPGEFLPAFWRNVHDVPPFFPNGNTLAGSEADQMAAIQGLVEARAGRSVTVKDAWGRLDLSPLGFDVLFGARWLYREAAPLHEQSDIAVEQLTTENGLAEFENATLPPDIPRRLYPAALLDNPDIVWLAGRENEAVVCGITAVRGHGCNQLNNLFSGDDSQRDAMIRAGIAAFPDLPATLYTRADNLLVYAAFGFREVGTLKIWTRPATI